MGVKFLEDKGERALVTESKPQNRVVMTTRSIMRVTNTASQRRLGWTTKKERIDDIEDTEEAMIIQLCYDHVPLRPLAAGIRFLSR
jgi:hypothetical protein